MLEPPSIHFRPFSLQIRHLSLQIGNHLIETLESQLISVLALLGIVGVRNGTEAVCDFVVSVGARQGLDDLKLFLNRQGPVVGLIHVHPDQAYFPKIASRMSVSGEIESNPIHLMLPEIPPELFDSLMKFTLKTTNSQSNE